MNKFPQKKKNKFLRYIYYKNNFLYTIHMGLACRLVLFFYFTVNDNSNKPLIKLPILHKTYVKKTTTY